MELKRVLSIAGSDSGGGAGIQADLKTITALGGFGMSVITALTAQNTLGVKGIHEVPVEFIEKQFDAVASDIGIDAAKTGMLASSEIIAAVARKIKEYNVDRLVVDPVMVAKGGARLIREDATRSLVEELLPLAFVVTPNIPEAEVLTGMRIATVVEMKEAARMIRDMGPKHVLVKGGHLSGDALDILYSGGNFHEFSSERFDTRDTHGTGCTFSAAIATRLAQGEKVVDALRSAKDYITSAIRFSLRIGQGHGPTNHFAGVLKESGRYQCLVELKQAVEYLKESCCGNIIPEIQSNLGYALPYATDKADVAAIPGRIIRVGEHIETLHDPDFGVSSHVARIILTLMRYNPEYRSAMAIRFSEETLMLLDEMGYDVAQFSRAEEPRDIKAREGSSLEWGTDYVLSGRETIPDAIFDRGDVGKEPVIRILGKSPTEVVDKVVSISEKLKALQG
ncbi:MAG: bifunctional hydroxymethylpyrimidine kinase/phosphomethylpyrimidine kinase [Deltaproteobacteria bacterium]|nr:bifunctional hydroxymethylpyrimidine kinase/phosphomethylpyrimidine kinase [Deltaproteobacteria bacterium]